MSIKENEISETLRIPATDFRHNFAEIIDLLERTGASIIITRHGKDVFSVEPINKKAKYRGFKKNLAAIVGAEKLGRG